MPTRLFHRIRIARPPQQVFDYATTPARWPEWHPSSLRLEPGAEQPLKAGARFEEDVRAGGRAGHLRWQVRRCEPPRLWIADAEVSNGAQLTLTYRISPDDGGVLFERELLYRLPNVVLRLLNQLLLRRRLTAESALSLQQLKQVLEQT